MNDFWYDIGKVLVDAKGMTKKGVILLIMNNVM